MQRNRSTAAIAVMLEKYDIACDMMHGFDRDKWVDGKPSERLALIPGGQGLILEQEDGKRRFVQVGVKKCRVRSEKRLTLVVGQQDAAPPWGRRRA